MGTRSKHSQPTRFGRNGKGARCPIQKRDPQLPSGTHAPGTLIKHSNGAKYLVAEDGSYRRHK